MRIDKNAQEMTAAVTGHAPTVFPLSLILPSIHTSATLPLEQYPADEQATP